MEKYTFIIAKQWCWYDLFLEMGGLGVVSIHYHDIVLG